MNCIIVEDDDIAKELIKRCIEKVDFLNLVGTASSGAEALALLDKNKEIDLIFLDIEMPDMTGFDLVKNFNLPQIIFVSGHKDLAAETYDYNITDFLLKPVDFPRFLKAVSKAKEIMDSIKVSLKNSDDLFIKKDARLIRVSAKNIIWIEALSDYVSINTNEGRFTILSTMKAIENKLCRDDFARIHRSYIIRLDKIKEIEDDSVVVSDKILPISRTHKKDLFNKLNLI